MKILPNELYWQLQGCGRVQESRYGISFWQHQSCYLPKSWVGDDLVIPWYQVHTYMYGTHILYIHLCRHEMHFFLNYVKMSFSILSFKYVGTCFLVLKTDCIINNNVCFYSYRVMYYSLSPLSNCCLITLCTCWNCCPRNIFHQWVHVNLLIHTSLW